MDKRFSDATDRRWMVQHWHLDHRYMHAPRAMVTFLLMLFLAFILEHVFYARNPEGSEAA